MSGDDTCLPRQSTSLRDKLLCRKSTAWQRSTHAGTRVHAPTRNIPHLVSIVDKSSKDFTAHVHRPTKDEDFLSRCQRQRGCWCQCQQQQQAVLPASGRTHVYLSFLLQWNTVTEQSCGSKPFLTAILAWSKDESIFLSRRCNPIPKKSVGEVRYNTFSRYNSLYQILEKIVKDLDIWNNNSKRKNNSHSLSYVKSTFHIGTILSI